MDGYTIYDKPNAPNEVFVFGSNLAGRHGAGAAETALHHWGAKWGQGAGHHGQSYAIPTKDSNIKTLPIEFIAEAAQHFIKYAKEHPELKFLLTAVGCGLAGYHVFDIAPLFVDALSVPNIVMPKEFLDVLAVQFKTT